MTLQGHGNLNHGVSGTFSAAPNDRFCWFLKQKYYFIKMNETAQYIIDNYGTMTHHNILYRLLELSSEVDIQNVLNVLPNELRKVIIELFTQQQ